LAKLGGFIMARNRGKKALYEVMSKARSKQGYGRPLEPTHLKRPDKDKLTTEEKSAVEMPKAAAQWWRKPRIVQLNAGRMEFSLPFPVVIALLLGLVLLVLVAFRLGQSSYLNEQGTIESFRETPNIEQENLIERVRSDTRNDTIRTPAPSTAKPPVTKEVEPAKPKGNNVIVLVEFGRREDLVPVMAHFAQYNIVTEIVNWDGKYFLITKDRYENFETGTEGYKVLQKIKQVGPKYKAPANYEPFSTHFFTDAYGRKVN